MTEQQMIALLKQIKIEGEKTGGYDERFKRMMAAVEAGLVILESR